MHPSHMKAKLQKGDWLIGNSTRKDSNRLVYAMRISEVLCININARLNALLALGDMVKWIEEQFGGVGAGCVLLHAGCRSAADLTAVAGPRAHAN
jgi:hypothetical protein